MRAPFAVADDPEVRQPEDMHESMIVMNFPRRVMLTLQDYSHMTFEAGLREVPESLANLKTAQGAYLKANGVVKYEGPKQATPTDPRFVELAKDLWKSDVLEAFAAYVHDPKALIAVFAKDARAEQLELEKRNKEAASKAAIAHTLKQQKIDDAKQKASEDVVTDATESARTGRPVEDVRREREEKEAGLPSSADLDAVAKEQEVVAAVRGQGRQTAKLPETVKGR